ncbi:GNAT family N-acetyltransferase [Opitutaceae bacterium TAV4]|uniref:GNAT family N-acetyltransferase n=1 Tax=Geminisphaera colitermitum TaxID=1148786 RepID=UPI000158C68A|nr:GNAT family N-acyltransferase [Geminisphaera colitermitum]RRJ94334.1 GNAT family N-acetyltransferase [Opitutaceae bacterium TAV4]RRJ98425.1 GNAT family N-acetyltransferase [Opitutaceae bacterium TAV3]
MCTLLVTAASPISVETERYNLRLASDVSDVRAAQRLRYEVFNVEMGEGLVTSFASGMDSDAFDAVCDHLIVREKATDTVVGTYRLQTGVEAGLRLGYYSEQEFDFTPFESVREEVVELGRACVAREHRNQSVLGLLWRGIAQYAQRHGGRYLVGCSSLTSRDADEGLAVYAQLASRHLAAPGWRTSPQPGLECRATAGAPVMEAKIPRLMAAYLAVGATICGEPAIDREFGTVDFLTWLDLRAMPERVYRKFMG